MKKIGLLFFLFLSFYAMQAQIVITEIMYNPPEGGSDTLEFIELYNRSNTAVDLQGYSFSAGVEYTFVESFSLNSGEFVIVAVDSVVFTNNFGGAAFQWVDGGLSNGGEDIVLVDNLGAVVDSVDYDDSNGWPPNADGSGASLVLCDFDSDNSDPANWASATTGTGLIVNGSEVFANPGADSECQGGPVVRFLETGMEINEADGSATIEVALFDGAADMTSTVDVVLGIGTSATIGQDFNFTALTVTFDAGAVQDTQTVTVDVIDDLDPESIEQVVLELSTPGGGASIDPINSAFFLDILDNDTEVPNLVIAEIMYNNPGTDDYEYLEIINNDTEAVNLAGFSFSEGITYTFGDLTLMPGEYVVLAADSALFATAFGIEPLEFGGALNNGGEDVELRDAGGNVVDRVDYSPDAPWDTDADGTGSSLILCDLNADNEGPANWQAAAISSGVVVNGVVVNGSPGAANDCSDAEPTTYPAYPIGTVTTNDSSSQPDSIGVTCQIQGVVYGGNLRPGGLQFTIIDDQNDGIHLFSASDDFGYTVVEGDEVIVQGTITQFSGLTQINPDTVWSVSAGNGLVTPTEITGLGEDTESQLVKMLGLTIVDANQWTNSGSGFNVDVTNGTDTIQMRVDADVDIFMTTPPDGVFNLTGIGGQFDGNAPYDEGYQLLPRYIEDIEIADAVSEAEFIQGVHLYPNPVSEQLIIELSIPIESIQLFNILGQELEVRQFNNPVNELVVQFDMGKLVDGIYIMTFTSEGSTWSTQVVKK